MGKVAPDAVRVESMLARAGIDRLEAVAPVHTHYDHAMDSAEHASGRTALIQGSAGFVPGSLTGRRADVAYLGVGLSAGIPGGDSGDRGRPASRAHPLGRFLPLRGPATASDALCR